MKQKFLLISLLLIWFTQNYLTLVYLQIEKEDCKRFVLNNLNTKHFHKKAQYIVFQQSDIIDWEIEGKEFKFNGNLYDVISMSNFDNKILVKCYKDKKETKILKHIKLLQNNHKREKGNKPIAKKIINFDYFVELFPSTIQSIPSIEELYFRDITLHSQTSISNIFKPPPQVF